MTNAQLDDILDNLSGLVAFDTRNPPRSLTKDASIFQWLNDRLPGFDVDIIDAGDGCLAYHAVRGQTDTLFNVHLDTVPAAPGWTTDPFDMIRADDRATGLGTCDIKGAAACLLSVAATTDAPFALLFSTDEEAGKSDAVRAFLRTQPDYQRVVVGEPTRAKAVTAHRGIISAELHFEGRSGHASSGGVSAIHEAAKFIAGALNEPWTEEFRLNVGRIEGGLKPNMVAAECMVRLGFRGLPGADIADRLNHLKTLAGSHLRSFEKRFEGPPLPVADKDVQDGQSALRDWLGERDIETAAAVDFWTEASLFAEAGYPATVLGPGDIAQAHAPDEFVLYEDLAAAFAAYLRIVNYG